MVVESEVPGYMVDVALLQIIFDMSKHIAGRIFDKCKHIAGRAWQRETKANEG